MQRLLIRFAYNKQDRSPISFDSPVKLGVMDQPVGHVYRLCEIDSDVLCDVSVEFNSFEMTGGEAIKRNNYSYILTDKTYFLTMYTKQAIIL